MIVTMQTERVVRLEQVRASVEGNEAVDFVAAGRQSAYEFIGRTLGRFGYRGLGKRDKGLVRCYLAKVTGLSRARLTRLVRQYLDSGRIVDRRGGPPARPFQRRYTKGDVRLLAAVDEQLGQMSDPATRAVMRREFEVFGDARFERLSRLSNGHLYNLRKGMTCRRKRTRPTGPVLVGSPLANAADRALKSSHFGHVRAGSVLLFHQ